MQKKHFGDSAIIGLAFFAAGLTLASGAQPLFAQSLVVRDCQVLHSAFLPAVAVAFQKKTLIELKMADSGDRAGANISRDKLADASAGCQESNATGEDKNIRLVVVGWSALVVGVHGSNSVNAISADALRSIYSGKVHNWRELGGKDMGMRPIAYRPNGSDLDIETRRQVFQKADFAYAGNVKLVASPAELEEAVAADPGAIGLSDWASLKKQTRIRAVPMQNVVLSKQNVSSGRYKFVRPLYLAVNKKSLAQNPSLRRLVEFVIGEEGQTVISREGVVNLAEGEVLKSQYAWLDRARILNLDGNELARALLSADEKPAPTQSPATLVVNASANAGPAFLDVDAVRRHRTEGEDPTYPRGAMEREIEGVVVAKVTIGADGGVSGVEFMQSNPAFERTVRNTVQSWKFLPFVINGQPASVYSVFRFVFKLS